MYILSAYTCVRARVYYEKGGGREEGGEGEGVMCVTLHVCIWEGEGGYGKRDQGIETLPCLAGYNKTLAPKPLFCLASSSHKIVPIIPLIRLKFPVPISFARYKLLSRSLFILMVSILRLLSFTNGSSVG